MSVFLFINRCFSTTLRLDSHYVINNLYKFRFKRFEHSGLDSTHVSSLPQVASIHDPVVVRRPGEIIDIRTLTRNYWSFPAVGFNSTLELPVYVYEYYDRKNIKEEIRSVTVPNEIFGVPIRPDILHRCYQFYRRAKAGYSEDMELYKWEWPGSTKKWRKQQKTGKARIGWKKSPGKYLGVFAHPLRPRDHRTKLQRRTLYTGLKTMLSVKFAQSQIHVVDSFFVSSHKTKYAVQNLRRILGPKCNSAMLVFEGLKDSNENFRWSTANIPSVRRETVEGVNVYNLLKYRQVVITEAALGKLIHYIQQYPKKCGWLPRYATPDNTPAPVPEKVRSWNTSWIESRLRQRLSPDSKRDWIERVKSWKWSSDTKGALKVPRDDPLKSFRLVSIPSSDSEEIRKRFQYIYDAVFDGVEELEIDCNDCVDVCSDPITFVQEHHAELFHTVQVEPLSPQLGPRTLIGGCTRLLEHF
nr:hypothetical protein MACL_00003576 [Theileria orientalis]